MRLRHLEKIYESNRPWMSSENDEELIKQMMYMSYRYAIYDAIFFVALIVVGALLILL